MLRFNHTLHLRSCLRTFMDTGQTIGFVPTMGALHEGHMDLIRRSREECDITVCSIFVNPTQFNDPSDLEKYPRTLEADLELLRSEKTDIVFHPDIKDIYPDGENRSKHFDFGEIDKVMEGSFRPGHFDGVAQVVDRLLEIVSPHRLYMGQKDFQQVAVVRSLLAQTDHQAQLVMVPTRRESHGLAMSSRNRRLSHSIREKAACIFEGLSWIKDHMDVLTVTELQEGFVERCSIPPFRAEYIEIVHGHSLKSLTNLSGEEYVVACAAVWAGDIRLIDNIILRVR